MATTPASRRMFTAERRMLERAGMEHTVGASSALDAEDLQAVIRQEVTKALTETRADIVSDIRTMISSLAPGTELEQVERAEVQAEVQALKCEREELLQKQEELSLVKNEVHALTYAIQSTKREIAALYRAQGSENRLEVMTYELDGIVQDTEMATQNIMDLAEGIDDASDQLQAMAEGSGRIQDLAEEISKNTMQLFEACNFQDLTGQRITKVVNTLHLIDERLTKIVDIWGSDDINTMEVEADPTGLDGLNKIISQRSVEIEKVDQETADAIMSQDDLDALFD